MKKLSSLIIFILLMSSIIFSGKAYGQFWEDKFRPAPSEASVMRSNYESIDYDIDQDLNNSNMIMLIEDLKKIEALVEEQREKAKEPERVSHLDINSRKYYVCDQIEWRRSAFSGHNVFKRYFFRIKYALTLKDGLKKIETLVKFYDDLLKYMGMETNCHYWPLDQDYWDDLENKFNCKITRLEQGLRERFNKYTNGLDPSIPASYRLLAELTNFWDEAYLAQRDSRHDFEKMVAHYDKASSIIDSILDNDDYEDLTDILEDDGAWRLELPELDDDRFTYGYGYKAVFEILTPERYSSWGRNDPDYYTCMLNRIVYNSDDYVCSKKLKEAKTLAQDLKFEDAESTIKMVLDFLDRFKDTGNCSVSYDDIESDFNYLRERATEVRNVIKKGRSLVDSGWDYSRIREELKKI